MDRNQAKEFYPILQAFAEGKAIECRTKPSIVKGTSVPNDWTEMKEIEHWNNIEYRIKPEPKYHPFKDAEECWQEMEKHKYFGWIKCKDASVPSKFMIINSVRNEGISITSGIDFTYSELIEYYTFIDGTPFGVKVEEQLWIKTFVIIHQSLVAAMLEVVLKYLL